MIKKKFSSQLYISKKPSKAKTIRKAVKRGLKDYGDTFRRFALG